MQQANSSRLERTVCGEAAAVLIEEQSLRDGLQMEGRLFSLEEKLELARRLVAAGVSRLQVGSLVDPRRVPQMARTEEVAERLQAEFPDLRCSALVLNARGLDRALDCGIRHLSMSVSLAESHCRKNAGCGTVAALDRMAALIRRAVDRGITVRAGLQCAFGCASEDDVPPERVIAAARCLAAAGAVELNLADTAGLAHPLHIRHLVAAVRTTVPEAHLSLHLHDTRGLGLVNLFAGYEAGVRLFDTAAGGLGGCPFVNGAAGNVATEDAVTLCHRLGGRTGIDPERLVGVVRRFEQLLGRELPGRMRRVFDAGGR